MTREEALSYVSKIKDIMEVEIRLKGGEIEYSVKMPTEELESAGVPTETEEEQARLRKVASDVTDMLVAETLIHFLCSIADNMYDEEYKREFANSLSAAFTVLDGLLRNGSGVSNPS